MNQPRKSVMGRKLGGSIAILCCFVVLLAASVGLAQETTGGLQGTVKDPTGAVVSNAGVELTGSSLVGSKKLDTDSSGYYRFANLPPGIYSMRVTAPGFTLHQQLKGSPQCLLVAITGRCLMASMNARTPRSYSLIGDIGR